MATILDQYIPQTAATPVTNSQGYDPAWAALAMQAILGNLTTGNNPERGFNRAYSGYVSSNPLKYVEGTQNLDPTWSLGAINALMPHLQANVSNNPDRGISRAWRSFTGANPVKYATPAAAPAEDTEEPIDPAKMQLARQAALDRADLYLRSLGYDPTRYMAGINAEFDKAANAAELADDPYSVFDDNIVSNVVQAQQAQDRRQFNQGYENVFGQAADNQAAPSSLLDDAINSILSEQRTNAVQQLDRGKARGIYNDVGYNAGMAAIDAAMAGGRSDLGTLGSGLIDTYRGKLDEIGDKAFTAASASGFDPSFSLDPYLSEYNDYATRTSANAAGDLRSALGGRNFFELPKIANSAGAAQGAINLKNTDVATALRERNRVNSMKRGLGSQGAF